MYKFQCSLAIGAMTSEGLTPLGEAVRRGRLDTVKYLVSEFNVDVCGKLIITKEQLEH